MAKLFSLARMTTATTGTGTITLGAASSGYLTFALAGVANGDVVSYGIKDGANSEVGTGTYTSSGTTLTRTVTKSTNSDAAINLSGTAEVFITPRKEDILNVADAPQAGGFVNAFRNGTFDIWQRGTSGTITAGSPSHTADGWYMGSTGANVTWSQQAGRAITRYCLRGTGATSVTDLFAKQRIESFLCFKFASQSVTVQAYIYNSTGGSITPTITVKHANSVDDWSATTTDVSAVSLQACANAAWTQISYTFTAHASSGNGLEVTIDFGNNFSTTGKYIQITEADIRNCAVVQAPELRATANELVFCQRYYEVFGTGGAYEHIAVGQCISTTQAYATFFHQVTKRANPTITLTAASNISVGDAAGNGQAGTAISADQVFPRGFRVLLTVASGIVAGNAALVLVQANSNVITSSAEL